MQAGDQSAFKAARQAERAGKPLPDVPPAQAASETPGQTEEPAPALALSKRQQKANEAIRDAVARATTDLLAENARLKAAVPRPEPEPRPSASATAPTWQEAITQPDPSRPMLDEAAFFDAYPDAPYAAYARYWTGYDMAAEAREVQTRTAAEARTAVLMARATQFQDRLTAAVARDPELVSKLPPAVVSATPLSGLKAGDRATFANVVAEAAFRSETPAELLTYLHAHPDAATAIASLPSDDWLTALARLDGRVSVAHPAPAKVHPKTLTDAPEPAVALGAHATAADPLESALRMGDQSAFKAAKRRERAAALGR